MIDRADDQWSFPICEQINGQSSPRSWVDQKANATDVCFIQSGGAAEASERERRGSWGSAMDGDEATGSTSRSQVRLLKSRKPQIIETKMPCHHLSLRGHTMVMSVLHQMHPKSCSVNFYSLKWSRVPACTLLSVSAMCHRNKSWKWH